MGIIFTGQAKKVTFLKKPKNAKNAKAVIFMPW